MPYSPPSRLPLGPRRRTLLASAAGVALLTGCSAGSEDSDGTRGGGPSAADRARARAARDSGRLVERYDAVIAAHPGLAERLTPLRAEVVRHREAFGEPAASASATAAGTASPTASPSPSPSASAPVVPGDEKAALADLATAERTLADERAKALLDVPGELARLLASVAAAGAAHAYLLAETGK
ncbi:MULTISPECIES: hypothetical protein [unclassified Streptomyces]|uniref:hypothetical protein n=1 Tax=unclassified Streptomyces TaxID=2593676 RepID=UPI00093F99FE|nr:hypothetical protein [Streptomyces sp. TSRI0107]OKJ85598.1 hypothetical protein AMK31_16095 [Streptomyces sp. TSRI0107]